MKNTLKKRLALGHNTLRVLTELPENKPRHQSYGCQLTFPASSGNPDATCPAASAKACTC